MRSFGVVVNMGGKSKSIRERAKTLNNYDPEGHLCGMTEYIGQRKKTTEGCRVWIYSRQSKREIADTFFHEMAHVFFQMIAGKNKQGMREENFARWIGYQAKALLADYSQEYARKQR